MKKINNEVSTTKKIGHFMKHYFGYVMLALCCALITVVIIGIG